MRRKINSKNYIRGFYDNNKAYYYDITRFERQEYSYEIMIGLYEKEGGTVGEMAIRWYPFKKRDFLSGMDTIKYVAKLEAYNDSWAALSSFPDLIKEFGKYDSENIQPNDIKIILFSLGFIDRTAYSRDEMESEKIAISERRKMVIDTI